jgi:sortase A
MKRKAITGFIALLVVFGSWHLGQGAWIYVKAQLAQYLLQQAWTQTVDGDQHVHPWPWADTWPVARLQAPSHRQNLIVLANANGRTLAFGPALVNETPHNNASGTIVVSGHRDTHFRFLKQLQKGRCVDFRRGRTLVSPLSSRCHADHR